MKLSTSTLFICKFLALGINAKSEISGKWQTPAHRNKAVWFAQTFFEFMPIGKSTDLRPKNRDICRDSHQKPDHNSE